jgi:hypothetical protein
METLQGMIATAIHEDRARDRSHPGRRHAAELRRSRPAAPSRLATLVAAIGRLRQDPDFAAGSPCTTADGRIGRLVARHDGEGRVLVCELP